MEKSSSALSFATIVKTHIKDVRQAVLGKICGDEPADNNDEDQKDNLIREASNPKTVHHAIASD